MCAQSTARVRQIGLSPRWLVLTVAASLGGLGGLASARPPEIPEMFEESELNQCGPYALQVCANYLGAPIRRRDVARHVPNGEVTTFSQLRDAAEKMGLVAVPVRWNSGPSLPPGAPAILAIEFKGRSHFVAALRRSGDRVLIVDVPDAAWMNRQQLRDEYRWKGEALHIARSRVPIAALYVALYSKQIVVGLIGVGALAMLTWRRRKRRVASQSGSGQLGRALFLLEVAACCWLLSGCNQHGSGPSPRIARVEPDQVTLDLSREDREDDLKTRLNVVNEGDSILTIRQVVADCSCTSLGVPSKKRLNSGETASIPIQLHPPAHGVKRSRVAISVEAGSVEQTLRATIVMRAPPPPPIQTPAIAHVPDGVVLRADAKGDATSIVRIRTYEEPDSPPWIERATADRATVAVELVDTEDFDLPQPGVVKRIYTYSLKVRQAPDDARDRAQPIANVSLQGRDSDVPLAEFHVRLERWEPFRLVPRTVFVRHVAGTDDSPERQVRAVFSDERFHPVKVDARGSDAWIHVKSVTLPQGGKTREAVITLELRLDPQESLGTIRGNLVVEALGDQGDSAKETLPIVVKIKSPT